MKSYLFVVIDQKNLVLSFSMQMAVKKNIPNRVSTR
jgi:hypothetical protein